MPSPSGEERAVADLVLRYLRDLGLEADEDDTGPGSARRWATSTSRSSRPPTASRSSSARTSTRCRRSTRSIPSSRTASSATATPAILGGDNKAAVVAMLEGVAPRARREPAARRHRAPLHVEGGDRARRAPTRSTTSRLRARVGYVYDQADADRRRDPGRPVGRDARGHLPRPRRARRDVPRGGPFGDRGRRARDRGDAARPHRRRDDREHRHDRGRQRGERRPRLLPLVGEARSHDDRKLADQVQSMQDAITFAAGVAECEVETNARPAPTRAYRFAKDDLAVRLAAEALARCGFAPRYGALGRRRRRQRLQRARPAVREPRERHGRDPHARRAHRRRRHRRDGRRHARARRRRARRRSACEPGLEPGPAALPRPGRRSHS